MRPATSPKTSAALDDMLRTGKVLDAAVARAVREAIAQARPRTSSARSPRPRSKRAA